MCTPAMASPRAWAIDVPLESNGLKKGRLNPLPGPQGHGAPFQQFNGTYKGNDFLNKTGISPGAPPAQPPLDWAALYPKPQPGQQDPFASRGPLKTGAGAQVGGYTVTADENKVIK